MTPADVTPGGTLVLDSEGLSKVVRRHRDLTAWLALAREEDMRVVTSAATLVEVMHLKIKRPALEWTLSRLRVEPITGSIARHAARLLGDLGLHGHRHAIDAMLSAVAREAPNPTLVLTPDKEDIELLCGDGATVITV